MLLGLDKFKVFIKNKKSIKIRRPPKVSKHISEVLTNQA